MINWGRNYKSRQLLRITAEFGVPKKKKFLYFPDIFEIVKHIYIYQILHIIVTLATLMLRRFHEIYFLLEIKRKRNFKQNSPSPLMQC